MIYDNQLRYAVNIIREYDGSIPLAAWLKDYFRLHKQMGSRDRKTVAAMVYAYFRLGHITFSSVEERIITGLSLTSQIPEITNYLENNFPEKNHGRRITFPSNDVVAQQLFPWRSELSENMDGDQFVRSFLVQPDLFLRPRPGKSEVVQEKLQRAGVTATVEDDDSIRLPNNTKLENIIETDAEAVIQDLSSQRTGKLLQNIREQLPLNPEVWDCCAGSGGKSIMAHDLMENINLTVTDIRPTIIHNLQKRFAAAGISGYHSFVLDIMSIQGSMPLQEFDLIIADAPCSGSGTWARSPEQLFFYDSQKTDYYQKLQKQILTRVIPCLKKGAFLLYITCSVFKKENEDVVHHVLETSSLRLAEKKLLEGYRGKADTLFAALFIN